MKGAEPMLKWAAIGLADVSEANLVEAMKSLGLDFYGCAHVTATESMASMLRTAGARAISIVELTDVIVWAAMSDEFRVDVSAYPTIASAGRKEPSPGAKDPIAAELRSWRQVLSTNRFSLGFRADRILRTFLRDDASDVEAARILRRSVRDLRSSIAFLVASNFHPEDFNCDETIQDVALDAWRHLESILPEFLNVRRDLWEERDALLDPAHELRIRVDRTLRHVFHADGGTLQMIHHGFYFYTPQQWALFQLLRSHPSVNQCFVVHDDGRNRSFESWRHYFVERWDMPRVSPIAVEAMTVRSMTLTNALEGRRVDGDEVAANLKIVGFNNSTEFVRHWKLQFDNAKDEDSLPLLFAPLPDDIERVIDRMGATVRGAPVNLANLPVGQFLLAVHDCIEVGDGRSFEVVLNGGRLVDMSASGFLDAGSAVLQPSSNVGALRRALPFFNGVRLASDWVDRAEALRRLVVGEVARFGPRINGLRDDVRIRAIVDNELRLAPWCDLTVDEAEVVVTTVRAAKSVVDEVAGDGMRRPDDYLSWIRKRLERAMSHLEPEERKLVEKKLHGLQLGIIDEVDIEGIKEIVDMILGRQVDAGSNEEGRKDGRGPTEGKVRDVRSLDSLGFRRSTVPVHVANLVESVFPAKASPYGWPFSESLLKRDDSRNVSAEILKTRISTAQLGDLYLLRLALDGVAASSELTLSWVTKSGSELRNPSSLLTLLTKPKVDSDAVRELAGGIGLSDAETDDPSGVDMTFPAARAFNEDVVLAGVEGAAARIDRAALGSAVICPRRFVLQWALGPSASYQSPHQHSMLYGNMVSVLGWRNRFAEIGPRANEARKRLVADLWRHLTDGQRASSMKYRSVKERKPSAQWQFIFTLGGRKKSTTDNPKHRGPRVNATDLAYRTAFGEFNPEPLETLLGKSIESVIPEPGPAVDYRQCNMCPVSPRCSARRRREE
jgi:hypothetical protein